MCVHYSIPGNQWHSAFEDLSNHLLTVQKYSQNIEYISISDKWHIIEDSCTSVLLKFYSKYRLNHLLHQLRLLWTTIVINYILHPSLSYTYHICQLTIMSPLKATFERKWLNKFTNTRTDIKTKPESQRINSYYSQRQNMKPKFVDNNSTAKGSGAIRIARFPDTHGASPTSATVNVHFTVVKFR